MNLAPELTLSPLSLFWELILSCFFPLLAPADIPDLLWKIQIMSRGTDRCVEGLAWCWETQAESSPRSILRKAARFVLFWFFFFFQQILRYLLLMLFLVQFPGMCLEERCACALPGHPCFCHILPSLAYWFSWGKGWDGSPDRLEKLEKRFLSPSWQALSAPNSKVWHPFLSCLISEATSENPLSETVEVLDSFFSPSISNSAFLMPNPLSFP